MKHYTVIARLPIKMKATIQKRVKKNKKEGHTEKSVQSIIVAALQNYFKEAS